MTLGWFFLDSSIWTILNWDFLPEEKKEYILTLATKETERELKIALNVELKRTFAFVLQILTTPLHAQAHTLLSTAFRTILIIANSNNFSFGQF